MQRFRDHVPLAILLLAWAICVANPAISMIERWLNLDRAYLEFRSMAGLLMTSMGWAALTALGAALLGWPAGRVLGKAIAAARHRQVRHVVLLAMLTIAPICIPSYVIFYAWWQSWPADSAIHQWVIAHQHMQMARQITLYLGLVCWSWPLVCWCVAAVTAQVPAQREELLLMDGVGVFGRMVDRLRTDGRGLLIGGFLVFIATFANTTSFDLAEVFTFANELRAAQALGANQRDLVTAAMPMLVVVFAAALVVWRMTSHRRAEFDLPLRTSAPAFHTILLFLLAWPLSVFLPLTLFTTNLLWRNASGSTLWQMLDEFVTLYRWSVFNSMLYAVIAGLCGSVLTIACWLAWNDRRSWVRTSLTIVGISWLVAAIVPGTLLGSGLQAAYNRHVFADSVAMTPAILIIGYLASFGCVAIIMGRWLALREPMRSRDLRSMDGVATASLMLAAARPRVQAAAFTSFAAIVVLSIGEIAVTAVVNPPHRLGAGPLTLALLNDMHYQRPQSVMIAVLAFLLMAVAAAALVAITLLPNLIRRGSIMTVIAAGFLMTGCDPENPDAPLPLKPQHVFGTSGTSLGQFAYPRAIDIDPRNERVFVIDKQARVQRLGVDGKAQTQWTMPDRDNGKPTGVSIAPDGRVFVADTHYFRVIAYDQDGSELMRFGEFGRGPGQFIYVTDVAFGPNGRLYVSEYGGNDRVQVFDERGTYLFEFSKLGGEHGQLHRPQSLAFNDARTELFIVDACNHRIVVVDPNGKFLRAFGSAGRGAGQLTYPYGLTILSDGSILVAEFGNNRLQRFSSSGKSQGIFGTIGRSPGQLQYPWGVASFRDRVFVLDSGNNRVQVIRTP